MRVIALMLFLFSGIVLADLSKSDIDGDGRISKAEAAGNAELMGIFDRADRDRDGRLTQAEMDSHEKRMKAKASASAGGTKAKTTVKARKKD